MASLAFALDKCRTYSQEREQFGECINQLKRRSRHEASNESTNQLFMLVIILVIGVLFATFRSPVDVGLTMFALMMAIIWS
ncbi:MAG TPA: hypothetical protein QGG11_05190, partial [Candidatus Poseidoniia archaeon]|nr:hypothetical protein [Candidatus Poseidoniia archaeon]